MTMSTKVALVTASSAGLGAATAIGLARAGFNVAINYHSSREKAIEVTEEINRIHAASISDVGGTDPAQKLRCIAVQADMSRRSDITRLVQEVLDHFGRLDCVVSNQGWTQMRQFNVLDDNMEEDDWDRCYNMNVKSHLFLFHAAQPYLAASKGSFITIASLAGVIPSGSSIPYSVSKAAQIHLVKTLATIAAPDITANSISPGILMTEWGQRFPKVKVEAAVGKSVLKKLADIEDVVQQIVFLSQTRSITGQNFVIDAGWALG